MEGITVALTYAQALFDAAKELGKTKEFLADIRELECLEKENYDFCDFLNSPTVQKQEKKRVIEEIFDGNICKEMVNFLFVLIDKDRTFELGKIAAQFDALVKKYEGFKQGVVSSAVPLDKAQMEKLTEQLGKLLGTQILIENRIDEDLIGGIKIQIDGKLIDQTVRHRLENMLEHITK